jgi:hypothetical protein
VGISMVISGLSALTPSELTELSGQPSAADNVSDGDACEEAFALLYSEALEISAAQQFEIAKENLEEQHGSLPRVHGKSYASARSNMSLCFSPPEQSDDAGGVLNKGQLADWMDAHALARSSHHCAMFCRQGLQAAGLNTEDRPRSGDAGDYGPFLLRHGAHVVPLDGYTPQVGDTAVFDKTEQHPNGHIEMFDGRQWVSDFLQHNFSPYRDSASTPPFTIYRLS